MTDKTQREAVLQFEIDRAEHLKLSIEWRKDRIIEMAKGAIEDIMKFGGTFVMVVTDAKITMVQRPDADEI